MKIICFEGASDDTFGWFEKDTRRGDDYDNCANGRPIQWSITSPATGESMLVVGQYCPGLATGWLIGVARLDEDDDKHLPRWTAGFAHGGRPYTPRLVVEVPDDAVITHVVAEE